MLVNVSIMKASGTDHLLSNYGLVDELGTVGRNCYRLRISGGVYVDEGYSAGD